MICVIVVIATMILFRSETCTRYSAKDAGKYRRKHDYSWSHEFNVFTIKSDCLYERLCSSKRVSYDDDPDCRLYEPYEHTTAGFFVAFHLPPEYRVHVR